MTAQCARIVAIRRLRLSFNRLPVAKTKILDRLIVAPRLSWHDYDGCDVPLIDGSNGRVTHGHFFTLLSASSQGADLSPLVVC